MDFNKCYITNFPYASSGQQNAVFFFSYINLRLTYIRGLILELSRNFPTVVRLCGYAGSSGPHLLAYALRTESAEVAQNIIIVQIIGSEKN